MKNTNKYLGNELKYLKAVLNQESWSSTGGSWVNTLESHFAKIHGMKYAIASNSGTSTLHAAIEAVGVLPGDEVIVPPLSVVMSTSSVIHANAIPVYADVDLDTFNISVQDIKKKITNKTRAIAAVALYGLPPNLSELRKLCDSKGIALIEDNAQCVLAKVSCKKKCLGCEKKCKRKGRLAGTFGDFSSYSFENTKHISCGEGGMLLTNSEVLAEKARKISGHGFKNLKAKEGRIRLNADIFQDPNYLRHSEIGWNYRMPEFNAAIALAQLERAEELISLRVKSAEIFLEVMGKYDFFASQRIPSGYSHSYYTLGVVYNGQSEIGVSWQDFRKSYITNGGDGIYSAWALTYNEPSIQNKTFIKRYPEQYKNIQIEKSYCKNAEYLQPRIMQFKTNYRNIDLAYIKAKILDKTIKDFLKKK